MTNWIKYAQWEESQKEIQRFELYKTAFMSIMPQLQLESTVFVKLKMPYDVLVWNSFSGHVQFLREVWMWITET